MGIGDRPKVFTREALIGQLDPNPSLIQMGGVIIDLSSTILRVFSKPTREGLAIKVGIQSLSER